MKLVTTRRVIYRCSKSAGGLGTAKILLHTPHVSDGFTALWERGRLDLTVEVLILKKKWHSLFSEEERQIAKKRLKEHRYEFQDEYTRKGVGH